MMALDIFENDDLMDEKEEASSLVFSVIPERDVSPAKFFPAGATRAVRYRPNRVVNLGGGFLVGRGCSLNSKGF